MNLLITGAKGQLGSEIKELARLYPKFVFFFESSKKLDITNLDRVNTYFNENSITGVINCAAYTAVDKAESAIELATKVNATGVKNIVHALKRVNGKLIHISTDYVFDGKASMPYSENDKMAPLGVYGKTKREGEQYVLNTDIEALVIRTSWLYSNYGNNFLKTMMRLGKEKETLHVVSDQIGTPTYAKDLAKVCLDILINHDTINEKSNLYHYSNEGVASWYDFSKEIMNLANIKCKIIPIETKAYPTVAVRPHFTVLNKTKIKQDFSIEIPHWKDSLKKCIKT